MSYYVNEVTFGKPLGNLRMGACHLENQPHDSKGWNLTVPPGRGKGMEVE